MVYALRDMLCVRGGVLCALVGVVLFGMPFVVLHYGVACYVRDMMRWLS